MLDKLACQNSIIHFGKLSESEFEQILNRDFSNSKKIIITDETVYELWIQDLITNYKPLKKAEIIQIPVGEEFKSLDVCTQIWETLSDYEIGRDDLIINFGGGVITDLGGFLASLFKRGLNFINVPTTLLSQVDASIGGKTGVNLGAHKNQIGLFAHATHIFVDDRYLETLTEEQLLSGYAEMLKHGLIANFDYWLALKEFDPRLSSRRLDFIKTSVQLKKEIVEKDPMESGLRKILNFGHTIGHGIEGRLLSNGHTVPHGFAVAWGIVAEIHISLVKGLILESEYAEIKTFIQGKFPSASISENDFKEIVKLMYNDKKNTGNVIQFSLINGIGNCEFNLEVSDEIALDALKTLLD